MWKLRQKLPARTGKRRQWRRSGVFIVNFELKYLLREKILAMEKYLRRPEISSLIEKNTLSQMFSGKH